MERAATEETAAAHPLVPAAAAFAAGILLADWRLAPHLLAVGALATLGVAALWRRNLWRWAAALLALAALGAARGRLALTPGPADVSHFAGAGYVTLRGVVAGDVEADSGSFRCEVRAREVVTADGRTHACDGRAAVRLRRREGAPAPDYGDTLELSGRMERPGGARNPDGVDYGAYLAQRQVFAVMTARQPSLWRSLPDSAALADRLARTAVRTRRALLATLKRLLTPGKAGLLAGIMLGTRAELSPQDNDDFTVTGTAHILAASGMNVGVIALLLLYLGPRVGLSRRGALWLTLAVLAFYTLMAGAKPSILRADAMLSIYLVGQLLDRDANGANTLAAAALALLAWQPGNLFDAGFLLSFAIVGCVLACAPGSLLPSWPDRNPGEPRPPWSVRAARGLLSNAASVIVLSMAAQIAAAPLTARFFNQVSLVAPLANAFILWPVFLLMAGGFAVWLLASLWPAAAHLLASGLLSPLLDYLRGVARAFAKLPHASLSVPAPSWLLIALFYAAFVLFMGRLSGKEESQGANRKTQAPLRHRVTLSPVHLVILLALFAAWRFAQPPPRLAVTFLDVGQGDAAVARTPGGKVLVVDTGRGTRDGDDMGRRVVLPYLRAQGINRVDILLLTHPDGDHVGGAATLLERTKVDRLVVSGLPSEDPAYRPVLKTARRRGVPVETLARGQALDFRDGVIVEALHPPAGWKPRGERRDNAGSLVLRLRCGVTSLLLTGDSEEEAEAAMLPMGTALCADVLKVAHHGSRFSSSERFLDAVRPQAAVISVSATNVFGHPHPAVLERLARQGARVFRTDRDGAVTVESDGRRLRITTMHDAQR